ncbi:MAG TPA: Rieske (2Fe-2S) protein [Acetobacteraceae bacterium]|nr:Rieske (2Fe-2S) protein [Acetobacteraceae bacterium]
MSAGAPVLGRLAEFSDRAAAPVSYRRADGREVAVIVVRRGAELRAYLDLCPHQFLPLTWRGRNVLSADGERLRCSNHGAEFAAEDGRGVSGPGSACGRTPVPLRVDGDGTVRVADEAPQPSRDQGKARGDSR